MHRHPRRPGPRPLAARPVLAALAVLASLSALAACEPDAVWTPLAVPQPPPGTPAALPFDADASDAFDRQRATTDNSALVADWFVHLPFALLAACALALALVHRRRARHEASFHPTAPLVDGPAVVTGTVEADPSWQGPFVQVAIHQRGREWQHKGQWHHSWREEKRDVNARPFVLVRDDGVRVQVDPGAGVRLRDDHGRIVRHAREARTRFAELVPGERAHVTGELCFAQAAAASAYRGAAQLPLLRPARGRPMVISTEPPGETSRKRMAFHRRWLAGLVCTFAFLALVVMPTYEVLSLTGETVWAAPTAVRRWREWIKPRYSAGYWVTRYSVRAESSEGGEREVYEDNVGSPYYDCVTSGRCPRVPVEVSSASARFHQIGFGPSLTTLQAVLLVITSLSLAIAYPISAYATRPWYQKRRVVEGARGRLG